MKFELNSPSKKSSIVIDELTKGVYHLYVSIYGQIVYISNDEKADSIKEVKEKAFKLAKEYTSKVIKEVTEMQRTISNHEIDTLDD